MVNKTFSPKMNEFKPEWHYIDATDQVLGRLATKVAKIIVGKNKAIFTPNENIGDKVVIYNASKIRFTGNKPQGKIYYHHTGFPKGLRAESLGHLFARKPIEVIRKAVSGMLPNNKLRKIRIKNLYIYEGKEHPHTAQEKHV